MPVLTKFENSAMKASFSLSSLRPSSVGLESPEHVRLRAERPYNSLTKKRKEPEKENWRRSWGTTSSREDCKDDFWAALQANYNYIMDNHLIESCTETNGELMRNITDAWSFKEFVSQFFELYSWLNSIQETVYSKDENTKNKSLCVYQDELEHRAHRRVAFTEQANRLMQTFPEVKDDVSWRLAHLNTKWDAVQQAVSLADPQESGTDVEHEVRCLRQWMREMESRLQPLSFRQDWTVQELEEKALEHMVLQRDIESHGKVVSSVVKLCERERRRSTPPTQTPRRSRRAARCRGRTALGLERRWHLLFLRSLEWQCHIETLAQQLAANNSDRLCSVCVDSDEEPVLKQPRLSAPASCNRVHSSSSESERQFTDSSDEGSYFEDGIEQTCPLLSNIIEANSKNTMKSETKQSNRKNMEKLNRIPVTNDTDRNTTQSNQRNTTPKEKKRKNRLPEECASVTKIDYLSPNNVTYYCRHNETDSGDTEMQTVDESSEDEWTYTDHQILSQNVEQNKEEQNGESTENHSSLNDSQETAIPNSPGKQKSLPPTRLDFGNRTSSASKLSKDELNRLVMNAEILASTPAKVRKQHSFEPSKYHRVKEWLNRSNSDSSDNKGKVEEQCDASGEYTTGESDVERESQSSEDLNESVATFRQINNEGCGSQNNSSEVISNLDTSANENKSPFVPSESYSSKVNLRPKRSNTRKNRPWSVACISTLSAQKPPKQKKDTFSHFSISESALHELDMASLLCKLTGDISRVDSNASCQLTENLKHGQLRKQKLVHFRKRSINRKSETGLDNLHNSSFTLCSTSKNKYSPSNSRVLIKSGSFSGSSTKPAVNDRCTASDPSNNNYVSTTSGGDTEDEKKAALSPKSLTEQPILMFKLGPANNIRNDSESVAEERDSSPEKTSLTTAATEEPLSLSEWDNYCEKYMSEPYSETPDSEAARRLLEFGEDYRNYIDSQSDCCSSMSTHTQGHELSPVPVRRRHRPSPQNTMNMGVSSVQHRNSASNNMALDSESDLEEFKHIIMESHAQLELTDTVFMKQITLGGDPPSAAAILRSDYAQIIATCRENLKCLQMLIKCQGNSLSTSEFHSIKGLVESWSTMEARASDFQRARTLEQQIITLRDDLISLSNRVAVHNIQSQEELEAKIEQIKGELTVLQHCKRELLHVNVGVHRFLTDSANHVQNSGSPTVQGGAQLQSTGSECAATQSVATHLKESVADLYRLWAETYDNASSQLTQLDRLVGVWAQFEARLCELQGVLRGDETTLRMLDNALQGGPVSPDVAISVRDVAKVLSEKPGQSGKSAKGLSTDSSQDCDKSHMYGSGWGSDSGISDEGSEQDLSERERRLAALRRLARQLEGVLAPDSQALANMFSRMEQTETELRDLQRICRALIVRTAVCAEVNSRKTDLGGVEFYPIEDITPLTERKSKLTKRTIFTSTGDSDPESDPGHSRSWLWRVLQASLPCQLAIIAIFCVACLLEPHCCDRINNLTMSFTPQLKYIKGPPPI